MIPRVNHAWRKVSNELHIVLGVILNEHHALRVAQAFVPIIRQLLRRIMPISATKPRRFLQSSSRVFAKTQASGTLGR